MTSVLNHMYTETLGSRLHVPAADNAENKISCPVRVLRGPNQVAITVDTDLAWRH